MAIFAREFSAIRPFSSSFRKSVLLILISFLAHPSALGQQPGPRGEFSGSATYVKEAKADFDATPEPDHPALMQLYMAANSDIIDTPALSREHFMVEPGAELHAATAARVAAPAYAAIESKQQEAGRHQPAHIEPGKFESVPDVNYRDLLRLYMSANADILNTDAFAIEYMLRFHNASITDRECDALNRPGKDEFTQRDFIRMARAKLKTAIGQAQSNRRKGFFRIRAPISLGEYDHDSQAFDIRSTSGMPSLGSAPRTVKINRNRIAGRFGGYGATPDDKCVLLKNRFHDLNGRQVVPFAMDLELPGLPQLTRLPMASAAAEALLARYRRGVQYRPKAIMELLIAVGPIVVGHGRTRRIDETISIETSLLAARALDEKGENVLHTYDLSRPRRPPIANPSVAPGSSGAARQAAQTQALVTSPAPAAPTVSGTEPAVLFRQHLAGLLLIRDNPDLISDQTLLQLTAAQIRAEQRMQADVERILGSDRSKAKLHLNPSQPILLYDWHRLARQSPAFANGALVDTFLDEEAGWSFVRRTAGFDARFNHLVEVRVFDPADIAGRTPEFAAQSLKSTFKHHLLAAAKRTPKRFYIVKALPRARYDFNKQQIRFGGGGPGGFADGIDLLSAPDRYRVTDPKTRPQGFVYKLSEHVLAGRDEPFRYPVAASHQRIPDRRYTRYTGEGKLIRVSRTPLGHWRRIVRDIVSENSGRVVHPLLAFDRRLRLSGIAMAPERAERVMANLRGATGLGLHVRIVFQVKGSQVLPRPGGNRVGIGLLLSKLEKIEVLDKDGTILATLGPQQLQSFQQEKNRLLEQERIAAPPIDPSKSALLPLNAETLDLMVAKHLPDALDSSTIERMILARWYYEQTAVGGNDKLPWGDFFLRRSGKRTTILDKPDSTQRAKVLPIFRQWTLERARTMPNRATMVLRTKVEKPGPVFLTGRPFRREIFDCRRRAKVQLTLGNTELADRMSKGCNFLEVVASIPARVLLLGNVGGGLGPRGGCQRVWTSRSDKYCPGYAKAYRNDIRGHVHDVRDVFVLDNTIHVPSKVAQAIGRTTRTEVEVDVEVSRIEKTTTPPSPIWHEAYGRFSEFLVKAGDRSTLGPAREVKFRAEPHFVHHLRIIDARLIERKTGRLLGRLDIKPQASIPGDLIETPKKQEPAILTADGGPNIIGISIGMNFDEAERRIRKHMNVGQVLVADRKWWPGAGPGKLPPYSSGRIFVSTDMRELILLHDEAPAAPRVVVGIVRQVLFGKGSVAPGDIFSQVRENYGKETSVADDKALIWGEGRNVAPRRTVAPYHCVPAANAAGPSAIWREAGKPGTAWYPEGTRYYGQLPSLITSGIGDRGYHGSLAQCRRAISAIFDARHNRKWDRLVIRLFDQANYARLYAESQKLIASGASKSSKNKPKTKIKF